jgi:pentatricopeptide repeat protein
VRAALDALLAAGLRPSAVTATVFLTALGDAGLWREARGVAAAWPASFGIERNAYVYNALMRACTRASQPAEALAVFREMQAARVLPSTVTFAILIRALEAGELLAEAEEMRALRASLTALALLDDTLDGGRGEDEAPQAEESFAPGAFWDLQAPAPPVQPQRPRQGGGRRSG